MKNDTKLFSNHYISYHIVCVDYVTSIYIYIYINMLRELSPYSIDYNIEIKIFKHKNNSNFKNNKHKLYILLRNCFQ